jgi:hypothetical protein
VAARRAAESQRIIAVGQTSLAQAEGVAESQQRIIADQQRKLPTAGAMKLSIKKPSPINV